MPPSCISGASSSTSCRFRGLLWTVSFNQGKQVTSSKVQLMFPITALTEPHWHGSTFIRRAIPAPGSHWQ
eukprot:728369-Hanusia_phi.AAC.6